ncbi:MAG: leucyl aminopeptidase [Propionibacteriaceae bacterium]|nr:leucyl aminopeptidase [Propionibacteriaceae bacterium]
MDLSLPETSIGTAIDSEIDVLVIGMAKASGRNVLVGLPEDLEQSWQQAFGRPVVEVAESLGAAAKPGTVALLAIPGGLRLLVTGVGDIDVTPEQVRRGAGAGLQAACKLPGGQGLKVALSLDTVEPEVVKGAVEGGVLGSYCYRAGDAPGIASLEIVVASKKANARQAYEEGLIVANAVCLARHWINLPANELYPESFAALVKAVAKPTDLEVDIWDEKALHKEGFGGILAVGSGSAKPPRLIKVSYCPRGAKRQLNLVGKGITFDSGGLNLKSAEGMYTMKHDMSGAASVIAAVRAIAELGLNIKVNAYAAMAENMPSGTAYRPSDVLKIYGGKTVENANTDAEGRLVLADALVKATEDSPDLIVDVATLTGACIVALGERIAGLLARDDETADLILDAAESAGELFWQLPIPEDAPDKLKSKVADLKSSGERWGGALTAAAFLGEFVPSDTSWAHLDIAGPTFNTHPPYYYVPEGATGMSVRTLIALAAQLAR